MQFKRARYRPSVIALHWLSLLLLIAVCATMELRGMFPRGSDARATMKTVHYFLGLSVFGVVGLRLMMRALTPTPAILPAPPAWQALLAKLMALALYALLLAMPVLGYLMLNADGSSPALWGFTLPTFIAADEALAKTLEHWHATLAIAGYWLVGIHAAAAIYHHHVCHDDTLVRMSLKP